VAGILSFSGRYRILHLTWFAFFLTFVVWFNFSPLATAVKQELNLTEDQVRIILLCNVALTVPARVMIGMLLDKLGPKLTFSGMLVYSAIPCITFALAQNFNQLVISRLAMSIVGCGFVIGIRMVAEWFDEHEIGLAEGIYGGWGNFGSAASAFAIPSVATALAFLSAAQVNWRLAIALSGIISAIYGVIYFFSVSDTPPGKEYKRPERGSGLEVTKQRDFWFLLLMNLGLVGALGLLTWRLFRVDFLSPTGLIIASLAIAALYLFQVYGCWNTNQDLMKGRKEYPARDRYQFKQVALLELTYFTAFGSELAVVSMLPTFYERTFGLSAAFAGAVASSYAFMNLVARPGGGFLSDATGSRKWTLVALGALTGVGYLSMSLVGSSWLLVVSIAITMAAGLFCMAAEGGTYAIVPLIKPRVSGQIAGNVGAYGTVGAVTYLTVYSLLPQGGVGNSIFFSMIGTISLIVTFLNAFFLKDLKKPEEQEEGEPASEGTDSAPPVYETEETDQRSR
jgi:NNP family nitrate/nitrite transporter-like MFS transporter